MEDSAAAGAANRFPSAFKLPDCYDQGYLPGSQYHGDRDVYGDATLNAEVTYYDYMKAHPDANIKIAALTEEASHVAIPLRKGGESESLRTAINQALAELTESGELSELSMKYFGSDISEAPQANQ